MSLFLLPSSSAEEERRGTSHDKSFPLLSPTQQQFRHSCVLRCICVICMSQNRYNITVCHTMIGMYRRPQLDEESWDRKMQPSFVPQLLYILPNAHY